MLISSSIFKYNCFKKFLDHSHSLTFRRNSNLAFSDKQENNIFWQTETNIFASTKKFEDFSSLTLMLSVIKQMEPGSK